MRGEMGRCEVDHFTGADKQHALLGNARIYALGKAHRRGGHRYRAGANVGFAAHGFRDRKCSLKQFVEQPAEGSGGFGGTHRAFELAENLRFAQHH